MRGLLGVVASSQFRLSWRLWS